MVIRLKAVRGAASYELRYGEVGYDGTIATWKTQPITRVKTPITISGLTPVRMYAFQVRSLGKSGYSDWSDSITRICT